jgi:hypothetical protein
LLPQVRHGDLRERRGVGVVELFAERLHGRKIVERVRIAAEIFLRGLTLCYPEFSVSA